MQSDRCRAILNRSAAITVIFIVAMFERLCTDDGTIAIEDQKAFEARRAMKVRALENQLRSEGATENDIGAWATKLHIADELG